MLEKTSINLVSGQKLKTLCDAGLSELFLVGGCVKKVGGCDELKTEREGGLHTRFLHLN